MSLEAPLSARGESTFSSDDAAHVVRSIIDTSGPAVDYGKAKLALDALVDPAIDLGAATATIDVMVGTVRSMAGHGREAGRTLQTLLRTLYEPGSWNDHRPFGYDHGDPLGQRISNKLLPTYLASRRGNCVSMPILLLILGRKLGLDLRLASAPLHIFVRYHRDDGAVFNLEAISGGHPARLDWYRRQMPMSDRAVATGLYMRSLTEREAVALMATTVMII